MDNVPQLQNMELIKGCTITATGAVFSGAMEYDDWLNAGKFLRAIEGSIQFALGDWINFGEVGYGEDKYAQALDETDYQLDALRDYSWVCRKIRPPVRVAGLSFTHHRCVAKFEEAQQKKFLAYAMQEQVNRKGGFSVADFKTYIQTKLIEDGVTIPPSSGSGLQSSSDYKNALIYIRDMCEETKIAAVPKKSDIQSMVSALQSIKSECIKVIGEKR